MIPYTLRKANDFVQAHHRHNGRTARDGGKFAIALQSADQIVGVAIVGNPLSATYMDGVTAEVLRVCLNADAPCNANSALYGACRRVWFAMGGRRILTYTLTTESGSSLRGAGWTMTAEVKGHDPATWGKQDHLRSRTYQEIVKLRKYRWESINNKGVGQCMTNGQTTAATQARPERRADELPLLSVMEQADMDRAKQLISDHLEYGEQAEAIKAAQDEGKKELVELICKYALPGVRMGEVAVYYGGIKSKRTFNKGAAALYMTAEQIESCCLPGKPYTDLRITDLSKPRKRRTGDDE